jgi:hypothetical protein
MEIDHQQGRDQTPCGCASSLSARVLKSGFRVPDALGNGSVNLIHSGEDVTGISEKPTPCLRAVPGCASRVARASEGSLRELDAPGNATVYPINSSDKIAISDPGTKNYPRRLA